jgi:hypothetical protein
MKALEFEAALDADHKLTVPQELAAQIPPQENVHVIVLLPEDHDWQRHSAEQFLAGYSEGDAIYDAL